MCVLHVSSLSQSFQEFINQTKLPVYQSHEKGEEKKLVKGIFDDFGFSCDVSEKPWIDFKGQTEDIKLFVETYRQDLMRLKNEFAISDWRFDLPYELRIDEKFFTQSDYLPPDLIKLLAEFELGLELTLYSPAEEKE